MKAGDKVVRREDGVAGEVIGVNEGRVAIVYAMGYAVADLSTGKQFFPTTNPPAYWKLAQRTVKCRLWAFDSEPDRVLIARSHEDDLYAASRNNAHWIGGVFEVELPEVIK